MTALTSNTIVDTIDIEPRYLKEVHSILARHLPYKDIWAYGSRVKWRASETSDLDCVVFDATDSEIFRAQEALDESRVPIEIQLLNWETIPNHFRENINKKYFVLRKKEEWREVRLGDVAKVIGGGTPKTSIPEYWDGEIPWITPRDLSNYSNRYISNGERNISQSGLLNSSAKLILKGAVLLTTRAPVGYLVIANKQVSTNQGFRSLIPNSEVDGLFLFYLLKNSVEYLQSYAEGSTFGELSGSTLKSIYFLFPSLPEQKAIAEVLSSLDDKIDLLHRQNKTLETIAQTLFRQWFIEEARDDWEETKLGDLVSIKGGTTPSSKEPSYWNGDIHWATPKDLSNENDIYLLKTKKKITKKGLARIGSGQLPVGAILLSSRAPIGYLAIAAIPVSINQGYIAIVCDKKISNYFMYFWCKLNMDVIKGLGSGTTFDEVSKSNFKTISIMVPPKMEHDKFNRKISPLFERAKHNQIHILALKNFRDTLLPKLMNGKIRAKI